MSARRLRGVADEAPEAAIRGSPRPDVIPPLEVAPLRLELVVAGQPIGVEVAQLDGDLDHAARFAGVTAVAEATTPREPSDIREGGGQPGFVGEHADRAQAGGIDEQPGARHGEELTSGGRVPAATVVLTKWLHGSAEGVPGEHW